MATDGHTGRARAQSDRSAPSDGLGWRLRRARESRAIGLRELARRIGVSPSLISQIETGKSEPSVSTLMAIVTELELPLNEIVFDSKEAARAVGGGPARRERGAPAHSSVADSLASLNAAQTDEDTPVTPVQRAHNRRSIHLETGVVWQRLTSAPDHDVDFLYVHYEPGGASTPSSDSRMRHNGREYGYVISGRLLVSIGFDDYELRRGDAIAFDSTQPHRLATIGDEPVEAIWFVVGRSHSDVRKLALDAEPAPAQDPVDST